MLDDIRDKAKSALAGNGKSGDYFAFSDQVFCFAERSSTEPGETVYEPALCLVLQGAKRTTLGDQVLCLSAGDSVLVSHHVPVHAQIVEATESEPYIALIAKLDLSIIRSLAQEIEKIERGNAPARAVSAKPAEAAMLDTVDRLLAALCDPVDSRLLGAALYRELHIRMLQAEHGTMLRELAASDSIADRIARAIAFIREHYRRAFRVADLAVEAGMSESSFHQRFKEVTGTTPSRYLKSYRLQEAHNLLSLSHSTVTDAAFSVGYKSVNHFSRDYTKTFGMPPREARALAH